MVMEKLSEAETARVLRTHKIPRPLSHLAKSKKEAVTYAKRIGFPVVMKVSSKEIVHKSDMGGVKLNISNEYEASKAYEDIMKKAGKKNVEGISIQKMHKGHKVIVGMKRDAQFGPVIAFGLGGIYVEVFKDITLRIAPVTKKECMQMIKETKMYPILAGARGSTKANLNKITDIIIKVSKLAMTRQEIKEIDFNPVIVNSKEAVVVDARLLKE